MRETEGKRRVSRSEAAAVLSLIIFIICFQVFTFFVNHYASKNGNNDYGLLYPDKPLHDSTEVEKRDLSGVRAEEKPAAKQGELHDVKNSRKPVITLKENRSPYGKILKERKKTAVDINRADSSQLVEVYGIGPYFAKKIIAYRKRLGGSYVSIYQLLEIYGIDSLRFATISKGLVVNGDVAKFSLGNADINFLRTNPYIGYKCAEKIISFRNEHGSNMCRLETLLKNNILDSSQVCLLEPYIIER